MQSEHSKDLRDGARLIAGSKTQTEALETLLAAVSAITPACGLLIVRGAQAIGWGCHGLATAESFKRTSMDCTRGVAATVISSCAATAAQVSELDPGFTTALGLESSARVLLVPVLLKERVAALLVALSQQSNDSAGVELMVQVAELTLDLQAHRKAAPAAPAAAEATRPAVVPTTPAPAVVPQAAAPMYAETIATRIPPITPQAPAPVYAAVAPVPSIIAAPVAPAAILVPAVSAPALPVRCQPPPHRRFSRARRRRKPFSRLWTRRTRRPAVLPNCWWKRSSFITRPMEKLRKDAHAAIFTPFTRRY